jgi:hypothetical protein
LLDTEVFDITLRHYYQQSVTVETAINYYGDSMKYADLDESAFITLDEYMNATNIYGAFFWPEFLESGIHDEDLFDSFFSPLNFTSTDENDDQLVTI